MFSKRSDTRIWLTDDARRLPVQIRSKFPFGTITLRLKEMVAARPRPPRRGRLGVTYREADLGRAHDRPRRRRGATRSTPRSSPRRPAATGPSPPFSTAFPTCSPRGTCARSSPASPRRPGARPRRGPAGRRPRDQGRTRPAARGPGSERGVVTHLALNGAAAIHDFELAAFGGTSEDVESGLADGSFGMAEETGAEMNAAIAAAARADQGMGEGLARALAARSALPGREASVLLAAHRARRAGHGARRDRRGDHPPASRRRRRRARRHQPPRFPPAGRARCPRWTRAARCSTSAARWCCPRCSSRR